MKLDAGFARLPYRFDADALAGEIQSLPDEAWQGHPGGEAGHRIVPLVTADGDGEPGRLVGTMTPGKWLERLPGIGRVLSSLDTVVGRTLLVELAPGVKTAPMVEAGYYWHRRVRVHVPLVAGESVVWICGDQRAHIPPGQAWVVNGWRGVQIDNASEDPVILLVTDTVGSASFWSTVNSADRPLDPEAQTRMSPRQVRLDVPGEALETETVTTPQVMSPWELENLVGVVLAELRKADGSRTDAYSKLESALNQFARQWHGIWAQHGESEKGFAAYRQALEQAVSQAAMFAGVWKLENGLDGMQFLYQMVAVTALKDADGNPVRVVVPGQKKKRGRKSAPDAAVAAHGSDSGTGSADSGDITGPAYAGGQSVDGQPPGDNATDSGQPSPLRSVHTRSLPKLLAETGSSLLVTTYQAGKLVVVREDEGQLNTHFRLYNRPMGLAADRSRMAIGTAQSVDFYRNMPEVAGRIEPAGKHDAAFLPRRAHVTGNIDIHEMAWAGDELWLVNTRFSCLCTLDNTNSFVPRWRPNFISGYAAEDRCHLNGLEIVDGKPRYVTALGATDTAGGWRENKAGGGILMDVESGEIICRGLSMPHSPRWYDGRLWVLESGNGSLATVDPDSGHLETVIELPGFTRGLSFLGPLAFVGLSQVRESAVFSGISLTERVSERNCGVWVVDLRSGKLVGFLRFEDAVQEVFAVAALPGARFPDVLPGNDPRVGTSYALPAEALKEVVQPATSAAEQ